MSLQTSAATHAGPRGSRWPLAVPALYLLVAFQLAAVVASVANGAYTAVLVSGSGSSSFGGLDTALNWALRLFNYGVGVAGLLGVLLLWRSNAPVRSLAGVAVGVLGADFALGLASDVGWSFFGGGAGARAVLQALGWVSILTSVGGDALTFEAVLKLRRDGQGGASGQDAALRGLFWAGWGPRLALWVLGLLGVRHLLSAWPMFGLRAVFTLLVAGAFLAALRAAIPVAESPAPASGQAREAPAAPALGQPGGREAGLRNLGLGILWGTLGGAVTVFSYASASSGGGGRYVVATGAIVAGLVQAGLGLAQLLRAR